MTAFVTAFLLIIPGIVLGHLALRDIARTGKRGHGLATAALIISYSLLALDLIFWLIILVVLSH